MANCVRVRTVRRVARRRQALLVLGVVGFVLVALLGAWQARARRHGTMTPVDTFLNEFLAPSVRLAGAARNRLARDVADPPLSPVGLSRLQQLEAENQELRRQLALRKTLPADAVTAEVIGRGLSGWQGYLKLGKGSRAGLAPHMVVLSPQGVVGQVAAVTPGTAHVLPLTDPASGIGALTPRGKAAGVLKGGRDGTCRLVYLSGQADVKPGDQVVTSGLSRYYPKGLLLGTVLSVEPDPALSSRIAVVQPAVDPARVEFVVLVRY